MNPPVLQVGLFSSPVFSRTIVIKLQNSSPCLERLDLLASFYQGIMRKPDDIDQRCVYEVGEQSTGERNLLTWSRTQYGLYIIE